MDTKIEISLRNVYGTVKAYPENAQAKRLAGLVGTKTLTRATLSHAETMGFAVVVKNSTQDWRIVE